MMQNFDKASLLQLFRENAASKRREERWLDDQMALADERQWQEHRDKKERETFQDAMDRVTEEQVADFRRRLDDYDTATVRALMENERQLQEARDRKKELLERAYQLSDGRKVFKTEDGMHVFDQNGQEVGGVDPHSMSDSSTKWEDYKSANDKQRELEHQRDELLKFQQKVDQARDKLDRDGTATDLDALEADLKGTVPEAVRRELGDQGQAQDAERKPAAPDISAADLAALPGLGPSRTPSQPNMQ